LTHNHCYNHDMNDEIVNIVDRNDNIIGTKRRVELADEDIIRVSSLWVEDGKGNVLLQQRAFSKIHAGGQWQPAVAGTVEANESYLENIIRETEEEIGLKNLEPQEVEKKFLEFPDLKSQRMVMYYKAICNQPIEFFNPEIGEVEQLKWINKEDLRLDVEKNPYKYVRSATIWKELFY